MKQNNSAVSRFVDHAQNERHSLSDAWAHGGESSLYEESEFDALEHEQARSLSLSWDASSPSSMQRPHHPRPVSRADEARFAEVLAEVMSSPSELSVQEARRMSLAFGPEATARVSSQVSEALFSSHQGVSRLNSHLQRPAFGRSLHHARHGHHRHHAPPPAAPLQLHPRASLLPPPPLRSAPRVDPFSGLDSAYEAQALEDAEARLEGSHETDEWFSTFLEREEDLSHESFRKIARRLSSIQDDKLQNSQWMQFVRDLGDGSARILNNQVVRGSPSSSGDWAYQYEESPFEEMERVWREQQAQEEQHAPAPPSDAYRFSSEPSASTSSSASEPFLEGLALFDSGRFSEAIVAFECEVRQSPGHARAWHLLAKCHQEGDADDQAIAALHRCVELDEGELEALLDLAVSYTNNMRKDLALEVLQSWLRRNPKYTHLVPAEPGPALDAAGGDVELMLRSLYEKQDATIQLFVQAALMSPEDVDADVQIALGLLFNLSLDYDRAVECFKAALSVKTHDYALWNKLGATLANSNRSEEAMQAYFQALERKPLYVRARANLGISFLALKLFSEAAKQFLSALSIQPEAEHIWSNLETAFAFMQREDLLQKARRMDVNAFRQDFDF